ncbi:glutamate-5-semialdehyde dehydrogenase [Sphingobacterium rhinopitheci]|uniref:glutamate-5-semialdehyde dehydrogenase n=1 Tax=Sphingobacterium rhinopitheci TaxID=2781960 RepID=UPI001F52271F|nr:glutamate-5-semialdehyde dehydrogenase [Sphingobacterium rhinopitheci]MCI0920194.1 glutamate-5-semialdehyde dehydrogenase [Sphingobacterium rhinopitheci]
MTGITDQLKKASKAKGNISTLAIEQKSELLRNIAIALENNISDIIIENSKDLDQMDPTDAKYDRLKLTEERIHGLAKSLRDVAELPDPTGIVLTEGILANGLKIEKKSVALGVVAVIYEARPNVTVDVAALCIQSGNVCLLRGGSDAWFTNSYLVQLIREELAKANVNIDIVQLLPTDRAFVAELLTATKYVDIIIPRGSQSLIDYVREHAKVPVIETGAGVCHTYVEQSADLEMAAKIVANAKISRPSVCNALDTILVDTAIAKGFVSHLIPYFLEAKVEVFADKNIYDAFKALDYPFLVEAEEADFGREFLDLKCSIRAVGDFSTALDYIATYSSKHSECIVSADLDKIAIFMNTVDAAAVYSNASTRFTDGGEFGLGAEIGISTQKLHARGPFALEKLVTEKWFITGEGQIR